MRILDWWKRLVRSKSGSPGPPVLLDQIRENHGDVFNVDKPFCRCLDGQYQTPSKRRWRNQTLHHEAQDETSSAWMRLLELVDQAAADGREEFAPGREMDAAEWATIVTLPPTIRKLQRVKHLMLYGSSLTRIPPVIGEMASLEKFTPYTSYRLHWFPYEITRCKELKESTVSTRALYGNYKYRPPFPRLPQTSREIAPERCSICNGPLQGLSPIQRWISLQVATDVLPLLVHACSEECLEQLPTPSENYISMPHSGGAGVMQPPVDGFYN